MYLLMEDEAGCKIGKKQGCVLVHNRLSDVFQ